MDCKAVKFNLTPINKLAYEAMAGLSSCVSSIRASICVIYETNKEMCQNCERLKQNRKR